MKSNRHVYMVQAQFVPKVLSGEKITTIRAERKRMPKAGEVADLRRWSGLPYRSKQEALIKRPIKAVRRCSINAVGSFYIDGGKVGKGRRDAVARADGFTDAASMVAWFIATHGLPFAGFITEWENNDDDTKTKRGRSPQNLER